MPTSAIAFLYAMVLPPFDPCRDRIKPTKRHTLRLRLQQGKRRLMWDSKGAKHAPAACGLHRGCWSLRLERKLRDGRNSGLQVHHLTAGTDLDAAQGFGS